jgi:two-component sensor histidine kinase
MNELVSNALKHAFPHNRHGEIAISFAVDEKDWVKIMVSDTGVGLPAGLDCRNTHSLGLQLVNMLVKQLRGRLTVESERDGTVVSITFPGSSRERY